jgi:hypothetical protein
MPSHSGPPFTGDSLSIQPCYFDSADLDCENNPPSSSTGRSAGNRSRPVEDFRGWLLVEAGFDGGAEPLEHGAFLQAAGF